MTNNSGPMLLTLVPQRNLSWSSFAISFGVQAFAVVLLIATGILCPQQLIPQKHYAVVQLTGMPLIHRDPAPQAERIAPSNIQHRAEARLTPAPIPVPSPALSNVIARSKPERAELPAVVSAPKPRIVNTGAFSSGSSAPATVSMPARKVQTGGFGDPNGIPGEGKAGGNLMTHAGSFDLPTGRGQGNGTGGTNGARGTVASAGFGNGVALGVGKDQGSS